MQMIDWSDQTVLVIARTTKPPKGPPLRTSRGVEEILGSGFPPSKSDGISLVENLGSFATRDR